MKRYDFDTIELRDYNAHWESNTSEKSDGSFEVKFGQIDYDSYRCRTRSKSKFLKRVTLGV